jgi:hypothetical protein
MGDLGGAGRWTARSLGGGPDALRRLLQPRADGFDEPALRGLREDPEVIAALDRINELPRARASRSSTEATPILRRLFRDLARA